MEQLRIFALLWCRSLCIFHIISHEQENKWQAVVCQGLCEAGKHAICFCVMSTVQSTLTAPNLTLTERKCLVLPVLQWENAV